MPQGHRHQKRAGSDEIFHAYLQVAAGFCLFCPPFQEGKMLTIRCSADNSGKRDRHTVIFKLFLFSETCITSVYPAAPASVTVTSATAAN